MQKKEQEPIEILNELIVQNNARMEAYDLAAQEIEGLTLQTLFARLAQTSLACKLELCTEVKKLGIAPVLDDGYVTPAGVSSFNPPRGDVMAKHKALFNSFELRESIIRAAYESAMKRSCTYNDLIQKQYSLIKSDEYKINNLRKVFVKA